MIRSLWISKTGMEAQQTQLDNISQQPRQRHHQRLQESARGVRGPDLPEPAPVRRGELRPDPAADRPAGRPRRAPGRDRAQLHAGQPAADRQPARRRDQRQRLPAGADARRHHRLHPRRLVPARRDRASSSPTTATPCSPGSRSRRRAEHHDRQRRHRHRRAARPGDAQPLGQLQLANFVNPAGLEPKGGNLYAETAASGTPSAGAPGTNGLGTLQQGFVETSNVNVVEELVSMIQTQRAYELNSKAIQTSDQMLQKPGAAVRRAVDMKPSPPSSPAPSSAPPLFAALRRLRAAQSDARRSTSRTPIYAAPVGRRRAAGLATARSSRPSQYRPLFEDHRARLVGDSITVQIVEKISATQKSTSSIDKSGKLAASVTGAAGAARPTRSTGPSAAGTLDDQLRRRRARPRTATTSPAPSPPSSSTCCPTATCWSPARSRSASTTTSTCCASPARSIRARSVRQRRRLGADRQRAHRAARPRRRRPRRRESAGSPLLFERSADLGRRRIRVLFRDSACIRSIASFAPRSSSPRCSPRRCGGRRRRTPRASRKSPPCRACAPTSWSATAWSSASTAPATRPRRRRSPSQSLLAMLQQMGVTLPPGTNMQLKNVAAVMVTA